MSNKCIFFDFDGTLANSFEVAWKAYNHIALVRGFTPVQEQDIPYFRELTLNQITKKLNIPKRLWPILFLDALQYMNNELQSIKPFEGIEQMLKSLKETGSSLHILSSNSINNIQQFLDKYHISEFFDQTIAISKLTGKARALKKIRSSIKEEVPVYYVGDEIRDLKAARKANIPFIAVTWGFNSAGAFNRAGATITATCPTDLYSFFHNI